MMWCEACHHFHPVKGEPSTTTPATAALSTSSDCAKPNTTDSTPSASITAGANSAPRPSSALAMLYEAITRPPTAPSAPTSPVPSPSPSTTGHGASALPEAIGRILDNRIETGLGNWERLTDLYRSEGVGLVICQELGIPSGTTAQDLRDALLWFTLRKP